MQGKRKPWGSCKMLWRAFSTAGCGGNAGPCPPENFRYLPYRTILRHHDQVLAAHPWLVRAATKKGRHFKFVQDPLRSLRQIRMRSQNHHVIGSTLNSQPQRVYCAIERAL